VQGRGPRRRDAARSITGLVSWITHAWPARGSRARDPRAQTGRAYPAALENRRQVRSNETDGPSALTAAIEETPRRGRSLTTDSHDPGLGCGRQSHVRVRPVSTDAEALGTLGTP